MCDVSCQQLWTEARWSTNVAWHEHGKSKARRLLMHGTSMARTWQGLPPYPLPYPYPSPPAFPPPHPSPAASRSERCRALRGSKGKTHRTTTTSSTISTRVGDEPIRTVRECRAEGQSLCGLAPDRGSELPWSLCPSLPCLVQRVQDLVETHVAMHLVLLGLPLVLLRLPFALVAARAASCA